MHHTNSALSAKYIFFIEFSRADFLSDVSDEYVNCYAMFSFT